MAIYKVAGTSIARDDKVAVSVPTVDVCLEEVAFRTYTGDYEWATSTQEDQQRKFRRLGAAVIPFLFTKPGVCVDSLGEKYLPEMGKPRITHSHSPDLGHGKNTGDWVLSATESRSG